MQMLMKRDKPRCLKGTRVEGEGVGAGWSRVKGYIKKEERKEEKEQTNAQTGRFYSLLFASPKDGRTGKKYKM